jgi:hypothetical protein
LNSSLKSVERANLCLIGAAPMQKDELSQRRLRWIPPPLNLVLKAVKTLNFQAVSPSKILLHPCDLYIWPREYIYIIQCKSWYR